MPDGIRGDSMVALARVAAALSPHFPVSGDHGWSSWGPQLAAMAPDVAAAIR